jgi:protein-L-isoaspartate(D-aspartate) O-methyltransferase
MASISQPSRPGSIAAARDAEQAHAAFVGFLKAGGHVRTPCVEAAFRAVRRDRFVPHVDWRQAYVDETIVTKSTGKGVALSSSSQPTLMAGVLEQLDVRAGDRILEVGAGTGYNAALLAHLAGPAGSVVTIDIDPDTVASARRHLDDAGYAAVTTICGDGALGHAAGGPYDRLVVTVAAYDITPQWRAQLKEDGRMVVPVSVRGPQKSIAFVRAGDELRSDDIVDCHYIPLRGQDSGWRDETVGAFDDRLTVTCERDAGFTRAALASALAAPGPVRPTGILVSLAEVQSDLSMWLAVQSAGFCTIRVSEGPSCSRLLDFLYGTGVALRPLRTIGVCSPRSLCMLGGRAAPGSERRDRFELLVRTFGDACAEADGVMDKIAAWAARGRPSSRTLRVTARPIDASAADAAGACCVEKAWHRYVFDWQE